MRLIADMHISPRTVQFLRGLGDDVVRVDDVLPQTATDWEILELAQRSERSVLTQDLDFSALVALSGTDRPSVISLRLSFARVDRTNDLLARVLPEIEPALQQGAVITIEDSRVRRRDLPIR